eukprot:5282627-Pyramimonas_sp.AAC.1
MEVLAEVPTHFDRHSQSAATLDRCFISLPGHVIFAHEVLLRVHADPAELSAGRLSDHGLMHLVIRPQAPARHDQRGIPAFIFQEPLYRHMYQKLRDQTELPRGEPLVAWSRCKELMILAARMTRDAIMAGVSSTMSSSSAARAMVLRATARAVWRQD